jgi:hypothetical protein
MKSISVRTLFSLMLLLSVSTALARPGQDVPVIIMHSPYESGNVLKDTAQKVALSGGVGLIEGTLAQKLLNADTVLENAGKGDAVAVLGTLAAALVLWKTGHMAREQLQDNAQKSDSWVQEMLCTLVGFAGFGAGMKMAK